MNYFDEYYARKGELDLIRQVHYVPTVAEYLEQLTQSWNGRVALMDENGVQLTYEQLVHRVACRRTLLLQKVQPGQNIGIWDVNSIDAVELFLAAATCGCTSVMLPAQLDETGIVRSCARFDIALLAVGDAFMGKCGGVTVPVMKAGETADTETAPVPCEKTTPCTIFFTGGTTGIPKGVLLNQGAVMRGTYNGTYGMFLGDSTVATLPLTHVFGMIFGMLSALMAGEKVMVCSQVPHLFGIMPQFKPEVMVLVPGMADLLLNVARMKGPGLLGGRLKHIICGGAPIPPRLVRAFSELGVQMDCGYGLTETANLVAGNFDNNTNPGMVGAIFPDQEVKLVDGEVWVKGDLLFDGYYKDPAATAACMEDGWFKTGDLATIRESDGFMTIVGRIKNLILLPNGENVSPEEVEEAFYRSLYVQDCLAKEGDLNGTPVIALEVLPIPGKNEEDVMADLKRINATLPTTMQVSKFILRKEDFKKTGALKIARNQ